VDEEEENDFYYILKNLTEIKVSLAKWKLLTMNQELGFHPIF
jgi:hypothetical protein